MPPPPTPPRAPERPYAAAARWEWRRADGGDPLVLATAFLADHGFGVRPLGGPARPAGGIAGAALLLGASAYGADLDALPPAAPTPCPEVPDAAVVIFGVAEEPDGPAPAPATATVGEWRPSWTRAEHAAAVDRVRAGIARGDLYQANVVGHRSAPFAGDPAAVASCLATVGDTPYAGTLTGDGWAVVSASPESFLTIDGTRATVRPIKGTAADPGTLQASAKDRAEHVMIVDLERNDLGRVARTGTVKVSSLYDVLPRAGVWHAESTVEADLMPGTTLDEVLAATFPGGSVTGAPKRAAMSLIHSLEPVGRGPSMGALGWVTPAGDVDLGLTIRTFAISQDRIHLWTGGGVTWGSDPAAEYAEAEAKARPLLDALAPLAGPPRRPTR